MTVKKIFESITAFFSSTFKLFKEKVWIGSTKWLKEIIGEQYSEVIKVVEAIVLIIILVIVIRLFCPIIIKTFKIIILLLLIAILVCILSAIAFIPSL